MSQFSKCVVKINVNLLSTNNFLGNLHFQNESNFSGRMTELMVRIISAAILCVIYPLLRFKSAIKPYLLAHHLYGT